MGTGAKPAESLDPITTDTILHEVFERAVHRVPMLKEARHQSAWTGIRSMTPDFHPIIGPSALLPKFVLNCGWGGEGVMQSPIAGEIIADLITKGSTSVIDVSPFRAERFAGIAAAADTELLIYARQNKRQ